MMLRNLIRRWLRIPNEAAIRQMILREIDADRAAQAAADRGRASYADIVGWSAGYARDRESRIALGEREDTHVSR